MSRDYRFKFMLAKVVVTLPQDAPREESQSARILCLGIQKNLKLIVAIDGALDRRIQTIGKREKEC